MFQKSYILLIVGVGSIGFRHFQSLSRSNFNNEIHILDKAIALKKFKKKNIKIISKSIFLHKTIKTIPAQVDLAIISTNSDVRANITQNLLNKTKIKFIIFEKFLFQKKEDFIKILKNLKKKKVISWVNCQRRVIPCYIFLKKQFYKKKIEMIVSGSNWGLTGNSIHFLDLFFYLRGKNCQIKSIENNLENKIIKSKRKGFIDLFGKISITLIDGSKIVFANTNYKMKKLNIKIKGKNKMCKIFEKEKKIKVKIINKDRVYLRDFKNYFVSKISGKIVKQILLTKKTLLPSISESTKYHLILLKIFKSHIEKLKGYKIKRCSIT